MSTGSRSAIRMRRETGRRSLKARRSATTLIMQGAGPRAGPLAFGREMDLADPQPSREPAAAFLAGHEVLGMDPKGVDAVPVRGLLFEFEAAVLVGHLGSREDERVVVVHRELPCLVRDPRLDPQLELEAVVLV